MEEGKTEEGKSKRKGKGRRKGKRDRRRGREREGTGATITKLRFDYQIHFQNEQYVRTQRERRKTKIPELINYLLITLIFYFFFPFFFFLLHCKRYLSKYDPNTRCIIDVVLINVMIKSTGEKKTIIKKQGIFFQPESEYQMTA